MEHESGMKSLQHKSNGDAMVIDAYTNGPSTSSLSHLPIKPSKDMVHMDVVESDKLEWLKDVSANPSAKKIPMRDDTATDNEVADDDGTSSSVEIRFDFEGRIVDAEAQYPTASALYHHDDQTRAGYTLQELFSLARSQFTQQRVIALRLEGF